MPWMDRESLRIGGSIEEEWVEITVSDNGPGIPPDLHDHIFELNYSGRGTTRPSKLGFGLWWVKTLMTRLGGSVSVESDGIRGTTFHLRLPQAEKPDRIRERLNDAAHYSHPGDRR